MTKERRHICKVCNKSFSTEKALRQHMRDKHHARYLARRLTPVIVTVIALSLAIYLAVSYHLTASGEVEEVKDPLEKDLTGHERLAMHIHTFLKIYVDGRSITIPAGIGISPYGTMKYIHTHDYKGVIHIETPTVIQFKLGDFFRLWGKELNERCFDNYCGEVEVTVNGEPWSGDPSSIPLKDNEEIIINVKTKT